MNDDGFESFKDKQNTRHKGFKKGIDKDDARRRREETTVSLRKKEREQAIQKRRVQTTTSHGESSTSMDVAMLEDPTHHNIPTSFDRLTKLNEIPQLLQAINSDDARMQYEATVAFRKLLSLERNPPISQVIDSGVVPRLVQFLSFTDNFKLQFEAEWAITNIASGTSEHTKSVIDAGAIPALVNLLGSNRPEVQEQAIWALGNIAGDSHNFRDKVLSYGALSCLLPFCNLDSKIVLLRNATWTLANFCRGKPPPDFNIVSAALGPLSILLNCKDEEVLTDACWALSYLSEDQGPDNAKIQCVIKSGAVPRLVQLLMHKSNNVKTPALRTIGNIVTGDDIQTQTIINCSALMPLGLLLSNPKRGIRKEACWTLSNITAGNVDQIQHVIEADLISKLIDLLKNAEFDIRKEAAWTISNATSGGTDAQIRYLVEQGAIPPLCDLFICNETRIINVALEGIENILRVGQKEAEQVNMMGGNAVNRYALMVEECGGTRNMARLQMTDNPHIFEKIMYIIQQYFELEEGDEEGIQPNMNVDNTGRAQFQFGSTEQLPNVSIFQQSTNQNQPQPAMSFGFGPGFNSSSNTPPPTISQNPNPNPNPNPQMVSSIFNNNPLPFSMPPSAQQSSFVFPPRQ